MQRRTTRMFVSWLLIFILALSGCGVTNNINQEASSALPAADKAAGDRIETQASSETPSTDSSDSSVSSNSPATSDVPQSGGSASGGSQPLAPATDTPTGSNAATPEATPEPAGGAKVEISAQSEVAVEGRLQVHFIDVGQGASQLIIGPAGKTMLIDGGDNDKEETIVAYLREQGIDKIDILIGTHPHADHIGGLDAVVDNFDIGQIYMPRVQANTKTFESLLLAIQRKGLKVSTAKAGLVLDFEPDVQVNMIAPVGTYDNTNDMSAVVHLAFGKTAFLFTGDAEAESEADILKSGAIVKADVLMVGHHGSNTSTTQAFLDKVDPTYAVIQVGKNSYGHPTEQVLARLSGQGVQIFRNDEQGTIVFASDGEHITVGQNPWTFTTAASKPKPQPAQSPGTPEPAPESSETKEATRALVVAAGIDNATPKQNSKVTVTVTVTDGDGNPVQGAAVTLLLHYKSTKTTYEGKTDATGTATLPFRIGRAAKDYTVRGDIAVEADGMRASAAISFTPQ